MKPLRSPFYSEPHGSWSVPLTQGVIALVDADVADELGQFNWHARLNKGSRWYAYRAEYDDRAGRRRWVSMHGEIIPAPAGKMVDHREHHPLDAKLIDNRRSNLRIADHRLNSINQRAGKQGRAGLKGACWHKQCGKWMGIFRVDGRQQYLGLFDTPEEAHEAYVAAAREHYGEFARAV